MQEEILFIQAECVFGFGVWCRRGWRKVVAVGYYLYCRFLYLPVNKLKRRRQEN